jgi:opacity protein-like surface antigen
MIILLLPVAAAVILWADAGTAGAVDVRPYAAINLGFVIDSDSSVSQTGFSGTESKTPGYAVAGALGLDFGAVRVEAEIGYRTTDIDKITSQGSSIKFDGTTQLVSYMLNGNLTVPGHAPVKPFIIGGVGIATAYWSDVKQQGTLVSQATRDTQIAYQAGIGASYEATRNVSIDGDYRYFGTTDFDIAGLKASYASHNVLLAVRYRF